MKNPVTPANKISARDIIKLLSERHSKDVFVPECKNGPTWFGEHVRLDAWAMRRSWAKACCFGYEVKVHRSDFLSDQKWRSYLDYCNEFYFVCPWGMIDKKELPDDTGLIWTTKNGTSLRAVRRAPHRGVAIPESLFRYVLMSRATISREHDIQHGADTSKQLFWKEWLEHKRIDHQFGYRVSRTLGARINEEIVKARKDNDRIKERQDGIDWAIQEFKKHGYDINKISRWRADRDVKSAISECETGLPDGLLKTIDVVHKAIGDLRDKLTTEGTR